MVGGQTVTQPHRQIECLVVVYRFECSTHVHQYTISHGGLLFSDKLLVETHHDLDLKKTPVKVTVERRLPYGDRIDEKVTVIPDGWLDFRMAVPDRPKPRRRCIVVELDRGTTSIAPFKQKLRALYAYAISEEYQELYGTDLCMVAYATTAGRQRLQSMIEWCEQELEQQRLEHEANLYRFTALPDGELDPRQVFCSPVWYKPYQKEPVSLLWQV